MMWSQIPNTIPLVLAAALVASSALYIWHRRRLQLRDIGSLACDSVIESLGDGVIVFDLRDRVVHLNPVAQRIIGLHASEATGRSPARLFADHPDLLSCYYHSPEAQIEILMGQSQARRRVAVRISPLRDRDACLTGRLIVLHDLPEQVQQELSRQAHAEDVSRQAELEIRRRLEEQTALREATAIISSKLDLSTVLNHIAEQMGQALDVTSAYFCFWDAENQTSVTKAEYYSPHACTKERVSDLDIIYELEDQRFVAALSGGQPWVDSVDDPDLPEIDRLEFLQYGALSILYIPLLVREEIIGFAELWESRRQRHFAPDEITLCQTMAQNAAIAIENARLYEQVQQELSRRAQAEEVSRKAELEIRKRLEEQTVLREATAVISSTLDLPALLNHIAEQMGRAVDATSAYISSWDPETQTSVTKAEYYSPHACAKERVSDLGISYLVDDPLFIRALQAVQPWTDHMDDPDLAPAEREILEQYGAKSVLSIPLHARGRIIAYAELYESRRPRQFTSEEMALCKTIAQNAAIAIENARLYEQTQQELTDRVPAEEALRKLNEELETRVAERTAELTRSNAELVREIDQRAQTEAMLLQRNRELLSLQSAIAATVSSLDLSFVLETVTWEMVSLLHVQDCTIFEWDQGADTISVAAMHGSASHGEEAPAVRTYHLADYTLKKHVLVERHAQQTTTSQRDVDGAELTQMHSKSVRAQLMLPMIFQERVVGLVEITDTRAERTFTDHEISLAQLLANQAASAIENARLYEHAQLEIAERKRAEEQIKSSLKEKEVLLKEIHHRVKNNLQVVSSLLNLQSRGVQDPMTLEKFQESQNRILSMALIHEKLYRSEDLACIDLAEYIRNLASDLMHSYRAHSGPVALKINAADVYLSIEKAVPCGLIINELISNALKHAFPSQPEIPAHEGNGTEGEIHIDLTSDHEQVTLTVADNGVGFPAEVDFQTMDSLGLRLVNTLTSQLEGTLALHNTGGTEFRLTFSEA